MSTPSPLPARLREQMLARATYHDELAARWRRLAAQLGAQEEVPPVNAAGTLDTSPLRGVVRS
jgi:hypothetical protein